MAIGANRARRLEEEEEVFGCVLGVLDWIWPAWFLNFVRQPREVSLRQARKFQFGNDFAQIPLASCVLSSSVVGVDATDEDVV